MSNSNSDQNAYQAKTDEYFDFANERLENGEQFDVNDYVASIDGLSPSYRERLLKELTEEKRFYTQPRIQTIPYIGKYRVEKFIGEGGSASVYKAFDPDAERYVAIKVPKQNPMKDGGLLRQFRQEATSMAAMHHPNIATVLEVNVDDDNCFIVFEYIDGVSLDEVSLDENEAVDVLMQVSRAVNYIHSSGYIHRDIKPGNIILSNDGIAKLTDFGLSKHMRYLNDFSEMEVVRGTPRYMSPEQARGAVKLDGKTDLFNLGLLLFELVNGEPYYSSGTPGELQRSAKSPSSIFAQRTKGMNRSLARVCKRCMMLDKNRRYISAEELLQDLKNWKQSGLVKPTIPLARWQKLTLFAVSFSLIVSLIIGGTVYFLTPKKIPDGMVKAHIATSPVGAEVRLYLIDDSGLPMKESEIIAGKSPCTAILKHDSFYLVVAEKDDKFTEVIRFAASPNHLSFNENSVRFERNDDGSITMEKINIIEPELLNPVEFEGFLIERNARTKHSTSYFTSIRGCQKRGGILGAYDLLKRANENGLISESPIPEWTQTVTKIDRSNDRVIQHYRKLSNGKSEMSFFVNQNTGFRVVRRLKPFGR